jgi:uncharacterized protein
MSESQNNTVTWWELQVSDLAEAQAFYGAVFGWSFQAFGPGFVAAAAPDGTPLGGLDSETGKGQEPAGRGARIYVSVEDLEQTLKAVEASGGTVEKTRTLISEEFGWWALFSDPSGLKIGLTSSNPA